MINPKTTNRLENNSRWLKWFLGLVFVAAGIAAVRALAIMSDANALIYRLDLAGWGKLAEIIVDRKIGALWHAVLMTGGAGLGIWLFCRSRLQNRPLRLAAQWLLVMIVVLDAWLLARHYIKTMPASAVAENDVIRVLKTTQPEKRVALLTQEGFYNHWLTFLFPYHNIKTVNVTQMPRLPADYRRFFEAVDRQPLRFWQLSAVGFVLAPASAWIQFQNDPEMKGVFELVYAYNVKPADFSVEVVPATPDQPGQHVIMRLLKPAPRFALIGDWEKANDAEALRRLGSKDYPLFAKVMIAPEHAAQLPASGGAKEIGQAQLLDYHPGKIRLRTSSTQPAILRVAERYDPDWRAWIDGQPTGVLRADFIFQGVYLGAGLHDVLLEYAPSKTWLWVQAAGFLIVAAAAAMLVARRRKLEL